MKPFLDLTKALADQTRLRALLALREGELCLCQLIDLLHLAPSTVSKHMEILYQAGLVQRRKQGRWQYFRLASQSAPPLVEQALAWTITALAAEPLIVADEQQLRQIRQKNLEEVSVCYRAN